MSAVSIQSDEVELIYAHQAPLSRKTEAQMLRGAQRLRSLLEAVYTMQLFISEAHGPATQEEGEGGRWRKRSFYTVHQCLAHSGRYII